MALMKIYEYPHPCLTLKASPVDNVCDDIKSLVKDMLETMYHNNGCGLAATQVNKNHRIFVMDVSGEGNAPQVFINPVITPLTEEMEQMQEGCLSVPDVYELITRPAFVKIEALNEHGKSFSLELDGLAAVCVQHELDHLDGKVMLDRLSKLKRSRALKKLEKTRKSAKAQGKES